MPRLTRLAGIARNAACAFRPAAVVDSGKLPDDQDDPAIGSPFAQSGGTSLSAGQRGPGLFRSEVLAERQAQWLGPVLIDTRRSHTWFTLFALFTATAVIGLLAFGSFTRTARVGGWLVPEEGMLRVFAPQPGVVAGLHVREGSNVRRGDRLLTLSAELNSAALGATQAEVARTLATRRRSLGEQQAEKRRLLEQQRQSLDERIVALRREEGEIGREIALQQSSLELAGKNEARYRDLSSDGFATVQQLEQAKAVRIEQAARIAALQRNRAGVVRERLTLEGERNDLPLNVKVANAELERDIAATERELAETEAKREIVVTAPVDGTVTAILTELGGHAGTAGPLLSIVPVGASLEAHLYAPSRAVGFVRPGQDVLLRYQPYPYQKFGHYAGSVVAVSRAALNRAELPPQLVGVGGQAGNDPVYRITVRLASQAVNAYGHAQPLEPGTQLEAEIALEKRRLYEWLLDPLYTFTGGGQP